VVNASNRIKIIDWIEAHRQPYDVVVEDLTKLRCMLALQGPRSIDILNPLAADDISQMRYYTGVETQIDNQPAIVSRTGYTGEDGFEVIVASEYATSLWERIIQDGSDCGLRAAGLGCRDTLRLEAGMPLYGHELDEDIDPITAGLSFAVKLKAEDFIGRNACLAAKQETDRKKRIGLELDGRRIAREGFAIYSGDNQIGTVTSGTFSPTFEKPIAMGYVAADNSETGTRLEVDIRGKRAAATIVALPFYKRS
jgi:aminomethyltransferase